MPRRVRTNPRKIPSQQRSQDTVEVILRATARILIKEGYDRASTNRIALAAGVSVGSLYQYFPSKEALVLALLKKHVNEMGALMRAEAAALAMAPMHEAIERAVRIMVAAHAVDPKLHKVLVEQVPRMGQLDGVEAVEEDMLDLVREYLRAKQDEIVPRDPELAAFIVVGIVEALTHQAVLKRPELLGDAFIREVSAAVYRYLKGQP
jgi:AcrR family transcriptional regulator